MYKKVGIFIIENKEKVLKTENKNVLLLFFFRFYLFTYLFDRESDLTSSREAGRERGESRLPTEQRA